MCTLTWSAHQDGYTILMNRDELLTRGVARPPRVHDEGDLRFVAPVDSDAGGTWIAVNERGLAVCLLNYYPPGGVPVGSDVESRGTLVLSLAASASRSDVAQRLELLEPGSYRAFTLFVMSPREMPAAWWWDGHGFASRREPPVPPITSSSFDSTAVIRSRTETYSEIVGASPSPDRLLAYHRSHRPERGPYSVCTHRDDGGSRSLTRVTVDADRVGMTYYAGPPCEAADEASAGGATCVLERTAGDR